MLDKQNIWKRFGAGGTWTAGINCRLRVSRSVGRQLAGYEQQHHSSLTLSGPAFSVVRQARGGSEAQTPKIKVNINRLKSNFAWVIISIKAFLMQNLRLIALLVWRYDVAKLPSKEGNQSSDSAICPRKMGLTFQKWAFMSRIVLPDLELTPMLISAIFKQKKTFSFSQFLGRLDEKRAAAIPPGWSILLKFGQNVS